MKKVTILTAAFAIAFLILAQSCSKTPLFRSNYNNTNSLIHETENLQTKPFLKAHLKNGDVIILNDTWDVDTTSHIVSGFGSSYNYNRQFQFTGKQSISIDNVSLFETNVKLNNPESGRVAALSVVAGLDVIMGIICLANPKACFGSCPTFYINEGDDFHYADAEGFSNAILPSMEYLDIDALGKVYIADGNFSITMKNEALETHCINELKLLTYPIEAETRVFHSPDNKFYRCKNIFELTEAKAYEGDITSLLQKADRQERFSRADENNMSSREEIFLNFKSYKSSQDLGLILHFRQTLMTTYLFYSAMGYMGNEVSDLFARLETEPELRNKFDAATKELGGIEVHLWNENEQSWQLQSILNETGPIAINKQFVPLSTSTTASGVKIKLVLNRGLWRIDYAALADIIELVEPLLLQPVIILNKDVKDDKALSLLNNSDRHLISMPGSEYKLNFSLPGNETTYEMFLYSKGYYLEWMRANWIKDKDLMKLKQMVDNPQKYLKEEAKNFKQYESTMEHEFWNSRIDTKTFVFYEN